MINIEEFPPYIKEYVFYLKVIKNRSEKTIDSYCTDLRQFLSYVNAKKTGSDSDDISSVPFEIIQKLTLGDVYEYLNYSAFDCKNNDRTRARKVSSIKGFFKALCSNKLSSFYLERNPVLNLDVPSPKKAQPKYLDLDSSRRLVEQMDSNDPFYKRDFCILMLFLNCGMRLSELVGLNVNDLNFEDRTIRLLGKGNKERIVHMNDGCCTALTEYLQERPAVDGENALFLSKRKTRITNRRVEQIVDSAIERIGLGGRGISTHKLRHTAATLMYQYGNVDPMVLKEILGHASVATTEIYTHLTNDNVRLAIDSNPINDERPK